MNSNIEHILLDISPIKANQNDLSDSSSNHDSSIRELPIQQQFNTIKQLDNVDTIIKQPPHFIEKKQSLVKKQTYFKQSNPIITVRGKMEIQKFKKNTSSQPEIKNNPVILAKIYNKHKEQKGDLRKKQYFPLIKMNKRSKQSKQNERKQEINLSELGIFSTFRSNQSFLRRLKQMIMRQFGGTVLMGEESECMKFEELLMCQIRRHWLQG